MREQLTQRLQQLHQEYESGQQMLADLQAQQTNLQQTLLRISGAIQVLQELLQTADNTPLANGAIAEETVEAEVLVKPE